MLKRSLTLTLLIAVTALAIAACASKPQVPPLPPDKELRLQQYPPSPTSGPMTATEVHRLGLRVEKLAHPTFAFVQYRYPTDQRSDRWKVGHWHDKVLPSGTMVAADKDGRPWYLLDSSNRLYVPVIRSSDSMPPPTESGGDWMLFGMSPWWLLVPAVGVGVVCLGWWPPRRRGNGEDDPDINPRLGADPARTRMPETGMAAATATGATAAVGTVATAARPASPEVDPELNALSERVGAVEHNMAGIRQDLAGIRESISGLEDRVVTRIEPTIRQAVDNGGKERAKALIATEIAKKAAENKPAMVASLTRLLESLG